MLKGMTVVAGAARRCIMHTPLTGALGPIADGHESTATAAVKCCQKVNKYH